MVEAEPSHPSQAGNSFQPNSELGFAIPAGNEDQFELEANLQPLQGQKCDQDVDTATTKPDISNQGANHVLKGYEISA
jgi:hypothetical protein